VNSDSRQNRNLAYDYDNVGNLIQKTDYQNEVTDYRYDSTNRLVSLRNPAYLSVSYDYDPAGRLQSRILSNNAKTDYTYYANGWLEKITNWTANRTDLTHAMAYEYDKVGNINKITDGRIGATEYSYNARYQLEQFVQYGDYTAPPFGGEQYTYDKVGNRRLWQKFTDVGNLPGTVTSALAYLHDDGNRLRQIRQNTDTGPLVYQYAYDDNGNLSAKATGSAYVYILGHDAGDRVTQINTASGLNTYQYDPYRYRIRKTDSLGTNQYLLEAEHLEAVYDETNTIRAKYLRGVVIDEIVNGYQYEAGKTSPTNLTYHHDHLQSMMALSAHEGTILEYAGYDPFGNVAYYSSAPQKPLDNPYLKYTGREYDPNTGLYYYRARYYDPTIGRFISEDPLGFVEGVNFYAYVNNNPINLNDPTGKNAFIGCALGGCNEQPKNIGLFGGLNSQAAAGLVAGAGAAARARGIIGRQNGEFVAMVDPTVELTTQVVGASAGRGLEGGAFFGEVSEFLNSTQTSIDTPIGGISIFTREASSRSAYLVGIGIQGPSVGVSMSATGPDTFLPSRAFHPVGNYSSGNTSSDGFVLYPSKPGTNLLQSVYEK
jgi:RHS repeat-associated protein